MDNFIKIKKTILGMLILLFLLPCITGANPWNGKVVLQGFWWDYWNGNFPNAWYNYLAELAPRLREMGIDAVWIPPSYKNAGTNKVGYSPFDHYDLGDKYQKGITSTRAGNKDEYLRMVAILHANGIDVIQDMVFNHVDDAGSQYGHGGEDPNARDNKWKNFRYVCYETPATSEDANHYYGRMGRWPKNWPNFHPNDGHNENSGDWCSEHWGPDICYYSGGYGQSSNATIYNPEQSPNYMRDNARAWIVWLKKQTGVDGFRLDAVKHFPYWATKDFLYNAAHSAGWASGGDYMFAVGEYVGSKTELDAWVNNVNSSDGYNDVVGTFDFELRQYGLKAMISADPGGSFDIGSLPSKQQGERNRTVPFVNNHDTFRPTVDGSGNYNGWDESNELGGGHIDPFDPRIEAAYAVAMAVDGSPQIFFEDLFNIGGTGKRWSHEPTNTTDLPVRNYLENLIWCHQKLNFKDGDYLVRWQAQDLLIIEREAHAIIGINDNWISGQSAQIQTNFGANVELHDYSGANSNNIWTDDQGRANIWVPPCNGSNIRRGYCVWGPVGVSGGFAPAQRITTQEWEMASDLGDSHEWSLQQGGALPLNSTDMRTAGKIYAESGKQVTVELYPEGIFTDEDRSLYLYSGSTLVRTASGTGSLTATYMPTSTGYLTIKVRNTHETNSGQKVWVKASYTAPKVVDTSVTGEAWDTPAPQGAVKAVKFDDNIDYIYINNNAFDLMTNQLTIEAWIKGMAASKGKIIGKGDDASEMFGMYLMSTGAVQVETALGTLTTTGIDVGDNKWHHVAYTYDGASEKIFVDGIQRASGTTSGSLTTNTEPVVMGREYLSTTNVFTGEIEEIHLWNVARTADQLREKKNSRIPVDSPALIGFWKFDEGTGTIVKDESKRGNTANLAGTTTWITSSSPVGDGQTVIQSVSADGNVDFSLADLSVNFNWNDGSGASDIVVTHMENPPEGQVPSGGDAVTFYNKYWVIDQYGTGSFVDGNFTFQLDGGSISETDTPANFKLFRRDSNEDGNWTVAIDGAAAINSSTDQVTFNGVVSLGQFTMGTSGDSPLPVSLISFYGASSDDAISIHWETEFEMDNTGFYIYKSRDNKTYHRISDLIPGHGASNENQKYSFVDADVEFGGLYYYRLSDVETSSGKEIFHDTIAVIFGKGQVDINSPVPIRFKLHQNMPNPFNPTTIISYDLPQASHVVLRIYDTHGRLVNTLSDSEQEAGYYSQEWDGKNSNGRPVSSGVYIYKIITDFKTENKRMILIK